jgi:polar amino acid transport system substrate-binding protein
MIDISECLARRTRRWTTVGPLPLVLILALWLLPPGSGLSAADHLLIMAPDLPGASEEGGTGRDAAIVRQVLALCGHETEFVVQPFGRHLRTFSEVPRYDAVMTVPLATNLEGTGTAAYIWYQAGAFYDSGRTEAIESIHDLAGLHVVTFRDGIKQLELEALAPDIASILEIGDLRVHSKLLMLGRVDAILADGLIIAEINRRQMDNPIFRDRYGKNASLRFAPIFLPLPYKMVFRDAAMAEEFDQCFDAAREGQLIYDINEDYISPLQAELRHSYMGF